METVKNVFFKTTTPPKVETVKNQLFQDHHIHHTKKVETVKNQLFQDHHTTQK